MSHRYNISSDTHWENRVGYSRAVRMGNIVAVAGTTAVDEKGHVIGSGPYEQTKFILSKIEKALSDAGADLNDVIRTRLFVTDIRHWEKIGRAHGEVFGEIKPASTMVEVTSLIQPDLLVEIEATAIINP